MFPSRSSWDGDNGSTTDPPLAFPGWVWQSAAFAALDTSYTVVLVTLLFKSSLPVSGEVLFYCLFPEKSSPSSEGAFCCSIISRNKPNVQALFHFVKFLKFMLDFV